MLAWSNTREWSQRRESDPLVPDTNGSVLPKNAGDCGPVRSRTGTLGLQSQAASRCTSPLLHTSR